MNDTHHVLPYGAWSSSIDAAMLAGQSVRLAGVALDGTDAIWVEGRPAQAGRSVLVRARDGAGVRDLTAAPWNVRSRVHEYGGGAFAARDGSVWFVHDEDQRLYVLAPGATPRALTPPGLYRHADPDPSPDGRRILMFEGEQHGFRRAETIVRTLEAELYFYGRVFGFTPAGDLEPVPIDNL